MFLRLRNRKGHVGGFTLLELLIVIGIIVILAAIVFVALDPAKRFAQARNAQRWSTVNSVLNAVLQYNVDNKGTFPTPELDGDNTTVQLIGSGTGLDCTTFKNAPNPPTCPGQNLDISGLSPQSKCFASLNKKLVEDTPGYLGQLQFDPKSGTAVDTRFWINKTVNNRIEVGACDAEDGETIKVTR